MKGSPLPVLSCTPSLHPSCCTSHLPHPSESSQKTGLHGGRQTSAPFRLLSLSLQEPAALHRAGGGVGHPLCDWGEITAAHITER